MLSLFRKMVLVLIGFFASMAHASEFKIVGTWEDSLPRGCTYRLTFTDHGEIHVISGKEQLKGTYVFHHLPNAQPIGRIERVITESNKEPDCEGRVITYSQEPQPEYVFLELQNLIHLCFDAHGQQCFARLIRQ